MSCKHDVAQPADSQPVARQRADENLARILHAICIVSSQSTNRIVQWRHNDTRSARRSCSVFSRSEVLGQLSLLKQQRAALETIFDRSWRRTQVSKLKLKHSCRCTNGGGVSLPWRGFGKFRKILKIFPIICVNFFWNFTSKILHSTALGSCVLVLNNRKKKLSHEESNWFRVSQGVCRVLYYY